MKYFTRLIFITLFISSCSQDTSPEPRRLINKFIEEFNSRTQADSGMNCYKVQCFFTDQANQFNLQYYAFGEKSMEELRIMVVFLAKDFLEQINANEKIRPHLFEFPFKIDNVIFSINLMWNDLIPVINKGNEKKLLHAVSIEKGNVYYAIKNEENESMKLIYMESFEEALKLVNEYCPGEGRE